MTDKHFLLNLDFDGLQTLVKACLPADTTVALYDGCGDPVWQSGEAPYAMEYAALAREFWQSLKGPTEPRTTIHTPHGELHRAFVRRHDDTPAGVLLFQFPNHLAEPSRAPHWVHAVTINLSAELKMLTELEAMVDDLTDRYEELNLVFALDAGLSDTSKAHQALHQLLRNCVEYRRAEFALLIHPEIRFSHHYGVLPAAAPSVEELTGDFLTSLLPGLQANGHPWIDNHVLATQGRIAGGYKVLAVPVRSGSRGIVGILGWIRDESSTDFSNSSRNLLEAMAQRVELIVSGSFDALTGLLNRSNFERSLQANIYEQPEQQAELFLLHLDIDYLQILNDTVGNDTGDQLIRDAGQLVRTVLGDQSAIAHFGSGKFYALLRQASLTSAERMAQNLCSRFRHIPCPAFTPTISIGLTPYSHETPYEDALAVAKVACAQAKKLGRNRIQIYQRSEKDFLEYRNDMEWFSRIHKALAEQRLELFGQAIKPVAGAASTQHFEVLLRMRGEQGEIIPPGAFLPTAERHNLMTLIDRHVIELCFDLLHQQKTDVRTNKLRLSVNLSAQSINDPEFQTFLLDKLRAYPWLTEIFCFEVTETRALTDLGAGDDFLGLLQSFGCHCALDDFGTGVSSFSYLKNLRVNSVKIDGSFIKPLIDDAICQAIVRSIHDVAVLKGIETVAEFVENEQVLQQLALIGIDHAQGYAVHKPEPLAPLLATLAQHPEPGIASASVSKVGRDELSIAR